MGTLSRAGGALRAMQRRKMVAGRLLVLRLAIVLVRALPRPVAFHGGRLLGMGFSFLPTARRRGLRANLAVAMDLPIDDSRIRKASRVAMGHWLLNFVDLFRIGRVRLFGHDSAGSRWTAGTSSMKPTRSDVALCW